MAENIHCAVLGFELTDKCSQCGSIALGVDEKLVFEALATDRAGLEFGEVHMMIVEDAERVVECTGIV